MCFNGNQWWGITYYCYFVEAALNSSKVNLKATSCGPVGTLTDRFCSVFRPDTTQNTFLTNTRLYGSMSMQAYAYSWFVGFFAFTMEEIKISNCYNELEVEMFHDERANLNGRVPGMFGFALATHN